MTEYTHAHAHPHPHTRTCTPSHSNLHVWPCLAPEMNTRTIRRKIIIFTARAACLMRAGSTTYSRSIWFIVLFPSQSLLSCLHRTPWLLQPPGTLSLSSFSPTFASLLLARQLAWPSPQKDFYFEKVASTTLRHQLQKKFTVVWIMLHQSVDLECA